MLNSSSSNTTITARQRLDLFQQLVKFRIRNLSQPRFNLLPVQVLDTPSRQEASKVQRRRTTNGRSSSRHLFHKMERRWLGSIIKGSSSSTTTPPHGAAFVEVHHGCCFVIPVLLEEKKRMLLGVQPPQGIYC
jgi:hypothetical protein